MSWVSYSSCAVPTQSGSQEAAPTIHLFADTGTTVRDALSKDIGKSPRGKTPPVNPVLSGADVYWTKGRKNISEIYEVSAMDEYAIWIWSEACFLAN